jgi:hypothetical protein
MGQGSMTWGFLVVGPEPLDWARIDLQLEYAPNHVPPPDTPGAIKLTDAALGGTEPNYENVTLLLRNAADLSHQRIEYRAIPTDPVDILVPSKWDFAWWQKEAEPIGSLNWRAVDGGLEHSDTASGPSEGDQFACAFAGDVAWDDYRLSFHVRADSAGTLGAILRADATADNCYLFSFESNTSTGELRKRIGGKLAALWQGALPMQMGQDSALTLECVGDRLMGHLDAQVLFDIRDASLKAGCIGFLCAPNTSAVFSQVQVALPTWLPYYEFGQEMPLPAGTQVRVYSGSQADRHSTGAGTISRFVASAPDRGKVRFPANGVRLRLCASGSAVGSARYFLPSSAFQSINVRLLRKADGTGFFMVPAAGTTEFASGQYRWHLIYRRNNRATDSLSQVYSQAGDRSSEKVKLEILA